MAPKPGPRAPMLVVLVWVCTMAPAKLALWVLLWIVSTAWRALTSVTSSSTERSDLKKADENVESHIYATPEAMASAPKASKPDMQLDPVWNDTLLADYTASLNKQLEAERGKATTVQNNARIKINSLESRVYELEAREDRLLRVLQRSCVIVQQMAHDVQAAEESGANVQAHLLAELLLLDGELGLALLPECSSTDASPALDQAAAALFHTPPCSSAAEPGANSISCASPGHPARLASTSKALAFGADI